MSKTDLHTLRCLHFILCFTAGNVWFLLCLIYKPKSHKVMVNYHIMLVSRQNANTSKSTGHKEIK